METSLHHSTHVLNPASVWRGCTVLVWGKERGAGGLAGLLHSWEAGVGGVLNLDICRDGRSMRKFKQGNNMVEDTWKRICGIDAEKGSASCHTVAFRRVVRPRPPLRRQDREEVLLWQASQTSMAGALGLRGRCKGPRHSYELAHGLLSGGFSL